MNTATTFLLVNGDSNDVSGESRFFFLDSDDSKDGDGGNEC